MSIRTTTLALTLMACAVVTACDRTPAAPPPVTSAPAANELPSLVPVLAPPVAPELMGGKRVFDKTCGLCHGAGTGGAPRPGDKASWAPRIAQGDETLYRHALEGFNGATGFMPARGGDTSNTDADVKAGVDYMVAMSK